MKILSAILRWYYRIFPREMVQYWLRKETERAYVTKQRGYFEMIIDGEKYPYPGFPRGHLLASALSKLKHQIKTELFNQSWADLEDGKDILEKVKTETIPRILESTNAISHLFLPPDKMVPAVREIWRAWTVVENRYSGERKEKLNAVKRCLTFILQEDDGYRFRVQWLARYLGRYAPLQMFPYGLELMEHAETLDDMKGRIRLLRRVLLTLLDDPTIKRLFLGFYREVDWGKVRLTKADKYYFRAKYFRVDMGDPNTFWGRAKNEVLY